jgi:hypothetical protein
MYRAGLHFLDGGPGLGGVGGVGAGAGVGGVGAGAGAGGVGAGGNPEPEQGDRTVRVPAHVARIDSSCCSACLRDCGSDGHKFWVVGRKRQDRSQYLYR